MSKKNGTKKEVSTKAKVLALIMVGFLVFGTVAAVLLSIG